MRRRCNAESRPRRSRGFFSGPGTGQAGFAVSPAFAGHSISAVLAAGAATFGHHRAALLAVIPRWVGCGCGHAADGEAQAGEQQGAARGGDVRVSGRRRQDERAVG